MNQKGDCILVTKINNWSEYYDKVDKNPPRTTLFKAIEILVNNEKSTNQKTAIDLGCGTGRDTFEILSQDIKVLAIDAEKEAINRLQQGVDQKYKHLLETKVSSFENLRLNQVFDLVNASFSLPFCKPDSFGNLWKIITNHIKKGGIFSGQFFGPNDEWSKYENMTFHSKEEIFGLFSDFAFEYFLEEEDNKQTMLGVQKHWHIFHIVAKKR